MSTEALRLYTSAECGADGYPLAWRKGEPRIPDLIRELAGHRCVRCGHPYRTRAVRGFNPPPDMPEWSPCDERCNHAGPVRVGSEEAGWRAVEKNNVSASMLLDMGRPKGLFVHARWRVLTVHHLTEEKADCRWWNLAALCQRCHLYIQGRVKMHQVYPFEHTPWFKPYAAGYYAATILGEDLTREEVEARQDELLALEKVA